MKRLYRHANLWWAACAGGLAWCGAAQAQFIHHGRSCCVPPPCCPVIIEGQPAPATTTPPPPAMTDPAAPAPVPMPVSDVAPAEPAMALSTFDSSVGYIDSAIPSNVLRLRYDASYDANRATRAEFLYAKGAPGPGLPRVELRDDFQELTAYAEGKVGQDASVFIELPLRWINPEINENHAGYGDMNLGFKVALLSDCDRVTSFQFRTYLPTGDSHKGLGTDHVSLEPALLCYRSLSDLVRMESELRYWIPVGGTDFAGSIVRYGIGFSYGERPPDSLWLNPVVELVGWTVLDGKETVTPPLIAPPVEDASGDTIVNLKLGARFGLGDRGDFYAGYGRALTGEVWYKDIWRLELRVNY